MKLAQSLFVFQPKEALAQALEIVRRNKILGTGTEGKDLLMSFLDILGPESTLSKDARQKLANMMF